MFIDRKAYIKDYTPRLRTGGSIIRDNIALCTPSMLQPFLTWLTACPTYGEMHKERQSTDCVKYSVLQVVFSMFITLLSYKNYTAFGYFLYIINIINMTSAFGLLQVGVYHYCSHNSVFSSRKANSVAGHIVSALCLLPEFDHYRSKHMRHHSHEVILTEEDEFTEFVIDQCGLKAGLSKKTLWIKIIMAMCSPCFHCRFLLKRFFLSTENFKTFKGVSIMLSWVFVILTTYITGYLSYFSLYFFFPLFIPFQITVVLRTLCEHHVPDKYLNIERNRSLPDHATRPVFAGCAPPSAQLKGLGKLISWTFWWIKMMTCHLLFRITVLVGDAARHDLHHARPSNRNWANYMCNRYPPRRPADSFCSDESWGCFSTVDKCISSISYAVCKSDYALFN